jgi:hypothetical protein
MRKISSQSVHIFESYRVNGRPDTLTDSIVYELFEHTKSNTTYAGRECVTENYLLNVHVLSD